MKCILEWVFAATVAALIFAHADEAPGTRQTTNDSRPDHSSSGGNKVVQDAVARTHGGAAVIPDFFFSGGTVKEFIEVLRQNGRKAGLPPLNVILTEDMRDQPVPQLELHSVGYADVFEGLNQLNSSDKNGKWRLSAPGDSSVWVLSGGWPREPMMQNDPLTGLPLGPGGKPPEPPKNCQIYQLQRYLTKYKVEDITTAIHTAWGMVGVEKGAELKYHKDTSLLIAVGHQDQLEIISRVLHSLEEGLALGDNAKNSITEVFVNGAVNRPGSISLAPGQDMDLLTALARAGGLTARANENKITFTRPGTMEKTFTFKELKQKSETNVILKPGDVIEVGEKLF
jgi:hypothetical protein